MHVVLLIVVGMGTVITKDVADALDGRVVTVIDGLYNGVRPITLENLKSFVDIDVNIARTFDNTREFKKAFSEVIKRQILRADETRSEKLLHYRFVYPLIAGESIRPVLTSFCHCFRGLQ